MRLPRTRRAALAATRPARPDRPARRRPSAGRPRWAIDHPGDLRTRRPPGIPRRGQGLQHHRQADAGARPRATLDPVALGIGDPQPQKDARRGPPQPELLQARPRREPLRRRSPWPAAPPAAPSTARSKSPARRSAPAARGSRSPIAWSRACASTRLPPRGSSDPARYASSKTARPAAARSSSRSRTPATRSIRSGPSVRITGPGPRPSQRGRPESDPARVDGQPAPHAPARHAAPRALPGDGPADAGRGASWGRSEAGSDCDELGQHGRRRRRRGGLGATDLAMATGGARADTERARSTLRARLRPVLPRSKRRR